MARIAAGQCCRGRPGRHPSQGATSSLSLDIRVGATSPVAPWAAELLKHWLIVRSELAIAGRFLFPSTRTGKQWLKPSQYESARRVLEDAGADSQEGGSFRLRHTFAIRQLRRGTAPEQVAR